MKAFLKFLLALWVVSFAVVALANEEDDLIGTLQSQSAFDVKCRACEQLKVVGTVKSVPALAALLTDEKIAHAARHALETMPYPEAEAALRDALGRASGKIEAGIIDSLGTRRDTAAVPALVHLLSDPEADVASASALALGTIGGKSALNALYAARDSVPPAVQPTVLDALLQCAERLLADGDAAGARGIYRKLLSPQLPAQYRTAGYRGLVLADPKHRVKLVAKALKGADDDIYLAALKLIRELDDPKLPEAGWKLWDSLPVGAQIAVLDACTKRGISALPVVRKAAGSDRITVRIAAFEAMTVLNDPSTVPLLAQAAASGKDREQAAARETLIRLHGPHIREAIFNQIKNGEPPVKVELLRALGERDDREASTFLLQSATADPEIVRLAALNALARLAVEDTLAPLLDLSAHAKSDASRDATIKALSAVCAGSRNKDRATGLLVGALGRADAAQRRTLLPLLVDLGNESALNAARAATHDPDREVAKEAISVLSQWPTPAAAPALLELAQAQTDETVHVLAVRGYVALIDQETDPGKKLIMLKQTMAVARSSDERKLVLGGLGNVPALEALELAEPALDDPAVRIEAAQAVVQIGRSIYGPHPAEVKAALHRVLTLVSEGSPQQRDANAVLKLIEEAASLITAWQAAEPYAETGKDYSALFDVAFAPENPNAKDVVWRVIPTGTDPLRPWLLDLLKMFGGDQRVAYARTWVYSPKAQPARLEFGADDGLKVWLNGCLVHAKNVARSLTPNEDKINVSLREGWNAILIKVTQNNQGWEFCARIVSPDGAPLEGLRTNAANPEAAGK